MNPANFSIFSTNLPSSDHDSPQRKFFGDPMMVGASPLYSEYSEEKKSPVLTYEKLKQYDENKQLGKLTLNQLGLTEEEFKALTPEKLGMKSKDFEILTTQQRITKIARQKLKQEERERSGYTKDIQVQVKTEREEEQAARTKKNRFSKTERDQFIKNFPDVFEKLLHDFNEILEMDVPSERISIPASVKDAYKRIDAKRAEIISLLLEADELGLLKPKSILEMLAGGGSKNTPMTQLLNDLKGKDLCHNALATDGLKLAQKIKNNLAA